MRMKHILMKLPDDLNAFWDRKKSQLKRQVKDETVVTNSYMFQAMVSFWKAMDTDSLEDTDAVRSE
jgi:hypothetical protein